MCDQCACVSNYTYAGFFLYHVKLRGLLEYIYAGLWEYVLIVKAMVPNRGAAAPWGAIYSAQGCRGLTVFFTISLKIHFQTVIKPQSKLLWVP